VRAACAVVFNGDRVTGWHYQRGWTVQAARVAAAAPHLHAPPFETVGSVAAKHKEEQGKAKRQCA